ncbi:MAG: ABC transporter ATP-binding protein/permease [Candidatus Adiutrix sp.]|jgi:ABC-type multidrug transport system fused ATPase/permease subunit|nr:ABC transporter ATP-binding protein/permease [Candidatus Adiutrix sp.]
MAPETEDEIRRSFQAGDLALLWRLRHLARATRGLMVLGAVMVLGSALAGVALPYVTSLAIDDYIIPVGPRLDLSAGRDMSPALRAALAAGEVVVNPDPGGPAFLTPRAMDRLNDREEEALIQAGRLTRERFYARPGDADGHLAGLAESRPDLVNRQGGLYVVAEKDLAALPETVLATWRSADLDGLARLALIFSLLMLLGYGLEFGQRVVLEMVAQRQALALRQELLGHVFGLSQSFFDRRLTGRLTSRLTNDVNNLSHLAKNSVATVGGDLVSLAVIIVVMFSLSPKLALITVVFTPLTVLLAAYFSRLSRAVQRDLRARLATINQTLGETIGGLMVIQAFRRERLNTEIFQDLNYGNYLAGLKQIRIHALFVPLIDVFASVILALVIWFGGGEVLAGNMSLGVVAAFIGYARRFFQPIQDLAEKLNIFQSAFASLERLTELLDENERLEEPARPLPPLRPGGALAFNHVNFRYRPGAPLALADLTFSIARGEAVALVGRTGSGKSSIINLIQRGYDPESGLITFDGLPLKELDLTLHRARLGLVTQDVYLYAGTVLDNLRLGRGHLTDADLKEACRVVGADTFIARLPRGYDEPLGPGGRHLSAGERQLLACARAFIETPEIIILDEATAAVDSETELLIDKACRSLFSGRTSITIAHRLSTVRQADRVLVLQRGRLIEQGSHQELLALKGAYYRMALLQGLA